MICAVLAFASSFTLAHGLLAWGLTFPVLLRGAAGTALAILAFLVAGLLRALRYRLFLGLPKARLSSRLRAR